MKSVALYTAFMTTAFSAFADTLPAPLKLFTQQGGKIVSQFDAPAGITGYVADYQGQVINLYVTQDGNYMFTGAMLDASGNNLGQAPTEAYINGPKSEQDWQELNTAHWVRDGSKDAKRIIYTFTDPNCPYCKKFWRNARPWVESGQVQIRHILVGILRSDSLGKAAAILSADDPSALLQAHSSGIKPLAPLSTPSQNISQQLQSNHMLMRKLGISATPATFYQDENGAVKMQMGLPPESKMKEIMASEVN